MDTKSRKKGYTWFSVVGILAFLFTLACNELSKEGNIVWDLSWTIKWLVFSVIIGRFFGCAVFFVCTTVKEKLCKQIQLSGRLTATCRPGRTFWISFGVLVLCWLPVWLAYYPGICTYDIPAQMVQVMSGEYNTHHPLIHTLLLEGFYRLGEALGNVNAGISLYALVQLLTLAAGMSGMIALLAKWKAKCWQLGLMIAYCALLPVNGYMSVTTTKDVFFSVFVLWFFLGVYAYLEKEEPLKWWVRVAFCLIVMGVVLFRNNGKYALAITWLVLFLVWLWGVWKKKRLPNRRRLFVDVTIGLLAGCVLAAGLAKGLNAQPGDKREMLSMPIQQLARTMVYHGGAGVLPEDDNTMEPQDKALLNELFLYEAYKNYRPEISDPVKRLTNTYVVRYRTVDFVKTYLNLLLEYPGDFINAGLAVNAGWLSLTDETHATINQYDFKEGYGYIQTNWSQEIGGTNLYRDSKWPWLLDKLNTFATENTYLKLPIVKYLVAPGAYLWCYMFLAAWLLLHKKYKKLLPFSWILGYYGTLILGPTVQMRYLYPLMVALPFFLIYVGKQTNK